MLCVWTRVLISKQNSLEEQLFTDLDTVFLYRYRFSDPSKTVNQFWKKLKEALKRVLKVGDDLHKWIDSSEMTGGAPVRKQNCMLWKIYETYAHPWRSTIYLLIGKIQNTFLKYILKAFQGFSLLYISWWYCFQEVWKAAIFVGCLLNLNFNKAQGNYTTSRLGHKAR